MMVINLVYTFFCCAKEKKNNNKAVQRADNKRKANFSLPRLTEDAMQQASQGAI